MGPTWFLQRVGLWGHCCAAVGNKMNTKSVDVTKRGRDCAGMIQGRESHMTSFFLLPENYFPTIHLSLQSFFLLAQMATPVIVGLGAITAALVGRHLVRTGVIGQRAAEQWVKGGFKAKMDRKEAIAILGLKYVVSACTVFALC